MKSKARRANQQLLPTVAKQWIWYSAGVGWSWVELAVEIEAVSSIVLYAPLPTAFHIPTCPGVVT